MMRGRSVLIVGLSTLVCAADLGASGPAGCADLPLAATMPGLALAVAPASFVSEFREPGNQFETRFGALAAGVGSAEQGTVDLNASFLTPRLNLGLQGSRPTFFPGCNSEALSILRGGPVLLTPTSPSRYRLQKSCFSNHSLEAPSTMAV